MTSRRHANFAADGCDAMPRISNGFANGVTSTRKINIREKISMAQLERGMLVRFNHERDGGPVRRVASVAPDGMVELEDMGGFFAPHLFEIADDIGDIPPKVESDLCQCPTCGRMHKSLHAGKPPQSISGVPADVLEHEYRKREGFLCDLMLDDDLYFWLRHDGVGGSATWDKWDVFRGARADANYRASLTQGKAETAE
jgi:hypothetical protein